MFRQKRFLPFFIVQALGALNDNVYKNAVLVLIVSGVIVSENLQINALVNFAAGIFILPFFLFSALAGQLADKHDKAALIRRIKLLEVVIMLAGAAALALQNFAAVLLVIFAMGAQSTFFGPIKYAILPQQLRRDELMTGNALVEAATFATILLGTMFGSYVAGLDNAIYLIAVATIVFALVGWFSSLFIPQVDISCADLRVDYNFVRQTWLLVRSAMADRRLRAVIIGISWFWFVGACYLTQIPNFVVSVLKAENAVLVLALCCFTLGIGLGAVLCDIVARHRVRRWLIFCGLAGIGIFSVELSFAAASYQLEEAGLKVFLTSADGIRIALDLVAIGAFGGVYTVPLYTGMQISASDEKRARVIAANNVINSFFLLLASAVAILVLVEMGWAIEKFFLLLGIANGAFVLILAALLYVVSFEQVSPADETSEAK